MTNKAAVLFEESKFEECIDLCKKAVETGREHGADYKLIAKALARMGGAYVKLGSMEEAKTYYEKSLTEHRVPDTNKKLQEVLKILQEREDQAYVNPEKATEEKQRGNQHFKAGKFPDAVQAYTEAIRRNPDDAVLYSNRAACYQKLMEFQMALTDCEQSIKLDPKFVKAYIRKGAACVAIKEYGRAQSAYREALDLDPQSQEALEGFQQSSEVVENNPEEVKKRAMQDPEVQQILGDPAMRMILEQMQDDPKAIREHLKNPEVAKKLKKLIEVGVVGMR